MQAWLGKLWMWVIEPILFTSIGSSIDFSTLQDGTVPKSIAIVCAGKLLASLPVAACQVDTNQGVHSAALMCACTS